jgi:hypothetical protein
VHGLATAALPHDAQCLALAQSISNTVDSVDNAIIGIEASHEITKVEKDIAISTAQLIVHGVPLIDDCSLDNKTKL